MTGNDFSVVDTAAIYRMTYYISYNEKFFPQPHDFNQFLKFNGDGTFLKILKHAPFEPSDLNIDKNSVWRGRFVISGNEIKMEEFFPQQAPIKTYEKKILTGLAKNDSLVINWDKGDLKHIYFKQPLN